MPDGLEPAAHQAWQLVDERAGGHHREERRRGHHHAVLHEVAPDPDHVEAPSREGGKRRVAPQDQEREGGAQSPYARRTPQTYEAPAAQTAPCPTLA